MRSSRFAALYTTALVAALTMPAAASPPADQDRQINHVLNRVAFGPRPDDVARMRQIGVDSYIDDQLHPERIDDSSVAQRIAGLSTLTMSSRELAARYGQRPREGGDRRTANVPLAELAQQKIVRAVYSERQLQEVLTDFWFNHFNVDARKGPGRLLLTEYERDTIRPHVLGRFRDLLDATAKSPAMLFYLDNWMSVDANAPLPRRMMLDPNDQNRRRGLNENYARELMELHTLGVDGGYTQKDVTEVARAFTGWTVDNPRQGGGFRFAPRLHDDGEKIVLGRRIKAGGGIRDGEQVLDMLAWHPSTARFISTALVRRFVADQPPAALVDRAAAKFRATEGDLRAVMTLILTSREFRSPELYDAKVKTPFEFVVSAVRTTGFDIRDARPLARAVQELGMPLYQCQPPTGYKDTADAWMNTGAIVNRINFASTFADGRFAETLGAPDFQKR